MKIATNQNGLCNRIKALLSAMRLDADAKIYWGRSQRLVRCRFSDLFLNDIEVWDIDKINKADLINRWEFVVLPEDNCELKRVEYLFDKTPAAIKADLLKHISILKPIPWIRKEVDSFKKNFDKDTITISLRTFSETKDNKRRVRIYDINQTYDLIEKLDCRIFITCDTLSELEKVVKQFPNKDIIYYKKAQYDVCIEGLQGAMVELYLGGLTKKLYATYHSSFSEMQWWFGGGNAEVEIFNFWEQIIGG